MQDRLKQEMTSAKRRQADPTHNRNHVLLIQAKHRTKDQVTEELSEELQTSEEAQVGSATTVAEHMLSCYFFS